MSTHHDQMSLYKKNEQVEILSLEKVFFNLQHLIYLLYIEYTSTYLEK